MAGSLNLTAVTDWSPLGGVAEALFLIAQTAALVALTLVRLLFHDFSLP